MKDKNEFDDPDTGFGFLGSVGPKAAFFIVLIALSFMVGLVWKLYTGGSSSNSEQVPIIRADVDGFKIEPDERGGMEVKFQDSTLFNDSESEVENLLADEDDEAPLPRSQLFAGLSTDEGVDTQDGIDEDEQRIIGQAEEAEQIVGDLVANGADAVLSEDADGNPEIIVTNSADNNEPNVAEDEVTQEVTRPKPLRLTLDPEPVVEEVKTPVITAAPVVEVKPEPAPKAKPVVTEAVAPKPKVVAASGDYYVQLASIKSKDVAEKEWNNFVKKYSPILNNSSYRVETADLGAKGVFHRIQAGPMSKSSADKLCSSIKSKSGSCLVKKK